MLAVSNYCPYAIIYSVEEQQKAFSQLSTLSRDNIITQMIKDYFMLREQIRECHRD